VDAGEGIATTASFLGDRSFIESHVCWNPDLYLKSSYLLLSKVLSGKASPYAQVVRGNIKLLAVPKRPIQSLKVLSFLKIPQELLLEPLPSKRKA
jgi:hypothetical protein